MTRLFENTLSNVNALQPLKDVYKSLILKILKTNGPLSDLGIWSLLADIETGGMSATVVICCIELQRDGYIEPPSHDPHIWQLSVKGLDYVASLPRIPQQEVSLGS